MAKKRAESSIHDEVSIGKLSVKPENIQNVKASDYRTIYSNNVAFTMSVFDFSFIFGEIAGNEGDKIIVEQKVRVTMSPQHAKVLAMVLIQNLKQYEETMVPISLPPGVASAMPIPTLPKDEEGQEG